MILIFIIWLLVFISCLQSIKRQDNRLPLIAASFLFNLAFIFIDQLYLENNLLRSFHYSDPSNYHEEIRHLSLENLWTMITNENYKSNQFYYLINWIYLQSTSNTTILALTLSLTNTFIFYSAFIIATREQKSNFLIDFIILFHPYLTMTLIRNVRDAYIIFFLSVFIYAIQTKKVSPSIKIFIQLFSAFFMIIIRPFFTAIMGMILANNIIKRRSRATIFSIYAIIICITFFAFYLNLFDIKTKTLSALFSTINTHEELDIERKEIISDVLTGGSSDLDFWISTIKRILIGVPIFLFTPNPINYTVKYYLESNGGGWGIYTAIDNILIILGSIINYAIVYPIMLKAMLNIKRAQFEYVITALIMFASYTVFQLGITDTRIKYTFLFFVLISIRKNFSEIGISIQHDKKFLMIPIILLAAFAIK